MVKVSQKTVDNAFAAVKMKPRRHEIRTYLEYADYNTVVIRLRDCQIVVKREGSDVILTEVRAISVGPSSHVFQSGLVLDKQKAIQAHERAGNDIRVGSVIRKRLGKLEFFRAVPIYGKPSEHDSREDAVSVLLS